MLEVFLADVRGLVIESSIASSHVIVASGLIILICRLDLSILRNEMVSKNQQIMRTTASFRRVTTASARSTSPTDLQREKL